MVFICANYGVMSLDKEPTISRFDNRTMCTEVPGLCRLPDPQNGGNAPSREIFLQKE